MTQDDIPSTDDVAETLAKLYVKSGNPAFKRAARAMKPRPKGTRGRIPLNDTPALNEIAQIMRAEPTADLQDAICRVIPAHYPFAVDRERAVIAWRLKRKFLNLKPSNGA